jgi:hypothetical protein
MTACITPTLRDRFWHASGGIVWHWRALRHGHRWKLFRADIAGLLDAWAPEERALLLIGPSAGWTLPCNFLSRFETLSAVEPDPLARYLFEKRFPDRKPAWLSIDAFAANGMAALLGQCPEHAVLFCNVVGQVMPADEAAAESCCLDLRRALEGRSWASYHDLVSIAACDDPGPAPDRADGLRWHLPDAPLEDILASHGRRGRILLEDHQTHTLARGLGSCTTPWPLRPDRLHLVQWVTVRADAPLPRTMFAGSDAVPG